LAAPVYLVLFFFRTSPIYALMAGHDTLAIGYVMEN